MQQTRGHSKLYGHADFEDLETAEKLGVSVVPEKDLEGQRAMISINDSPWST
jgi:hypothetical protein